MFSSFREFFFQAGGYLARARTVCPSEHLDTFLFIFLYKAKQYANIEQTIRDFHFVGRIDNKLLVDKSIFCYGTLSDKDIFPIFQSVMPCIAI